MKICKLTALIVLSALCFSLPVQAGRSAARGTITQPAQKKDKVIATKTAKGRLKGFEVGDYVHAVIILANGKETSFFIGGAGVDYFLAQHKGQPLVLTYQIVDSYIPEAGGKMRIERLSGVRAGNLTSAAWWKKKRAKYSVAQLDKMYGDSVEKLRLNP